MTTLHTTYGFKIFQESYPRPCGMNSLVYIGRKPQPNNQYTNIIEQAKRTGYAVVVNYADDKQTGLVAL